MESSLYIHIPFCRKKCDYCDFYSIPKPSDLSDSYIDAVIKEVAYYSNLYKIDSWKTIYVGGGTPSLLSPFQIKTLFSGIKQIAPYSSDYEITVEMNPEGVREDFINACVESGVNRLSLGIQALNDKALSSVHRGCSVESCKNALSFLDKTWNGRLSVDFIAGLPNHSIESFKQQFEQIFEYKKIDHISLYTLTIEEGTPLFKNIDSGKTKFSYDKADKMWLIGRNILEKNGFIQYEVSNFAKEGFESKHNSTYWNLSNYIGCGSGASGTWYGIEKYENAIRWTNTKNISEYNNFWLKKFDEKNIPREIENLDKKTLEFEFLMMGFRMLKGISSVDFEKRFGYSLLEYKNSDGKSFERIFEEWQKTKKAKQSEEYFSLNKKGILFLNTFLEELL